MKRIKKTRLEIFQGLCSEVVNTVRRFNEFTPPVTHEKTTDDTSNSFTHSFKCGKCSLHFNLYSDYKTRSHAICPECGNVMWIVDETHMVTIDPVTGTGVNGLHCVNGSDKFIFQQVNFVPAEQVVEEPAMSAN